MRKLIFTLFASTMMFSGTISAAGAEAPATISVPSSETAVEQVSSSAAKALSGTYTAKYNSNVRLDAGTKHKVVFLAKKGTKLKATHQKKVGKETWYKVSANGKSGWVLSTLVSKDAAKAAAKPAAKKAPAATALSGTYTVKQNANVRKDGGTKHAILFTAKKGTQLKASHQKKVGKETWYKVSTNGKSGWILSTLVTKSTAKAAAKPAAKAPAATALSGTYTVKQNANVRKDGGTKHAILFTAKKGTQVKASHQKKVGKETWYKVSVNGKSGWILSTLVSKSTAKVSASAKADSSKGASIVSTAMALRGTPYVFGGTTTRGFDCSGFTQYVFKKNGINLSRSTLTQFAETKAVSTPQVGDLVFFANTYRAGISHVGIYIGNNQFVHAGGSKAEVRSMNDSYFGPKFHSFRR